MRLEDYAKAARGTFCLYCKKPLDVQKVENYRHPEGWRVTGFAELQWLYVKCSKCDNGNSLSELGVPGCASAHHARIAEDLAALRYAPVRP
jgi:hypothetical protein